CAGQCFCSHDNRSFDLRFGLFLLVHHHQEESRVVMQNLNAIAVPTFFYHS
ncbi:MAG: hypothetical protein ACI9R3_004977, partial [Verrucomicrobiales bacterium]